MISKRFFLSILRLSSRRQRPRLRGRGVYIISTGRTATNFLAQFLDEAPQVLAVHEPRPSWRLRLWSGARLEGYATEVDMRRAFAALRPFPGSETQPIVIESNPMLFGFSHGIRAVQPDAKIVHIVRDPREYIRSAIEHGNDQGLKGFLNRYLPFWIANPGDAVSLKNETGTTELLAKYWTNINRCIADDNVDNPNYLRLRFEDLFSDDAAMHQLTEFIGVSTDGAPMRQRARTNQGNAVTKGGWRTWSAEEVRVTADHCRPLMEQFDYGTEREWNDMMRELDGT